jgi:endopeptidase La
MLDIISANELNLCIGNLENQFTILMGLLNKLVQNSKVDLDFFADKLQEINDELASIFKSYGTHSFIDLIKICLGNDYIIKQINTQALMNKYEIITHFVHPISYKIINWKNDKNEKNKEKQTENKIIHKNRIVEDFMIVETSENLDCFDLARNGKSFQSKVYGIKVTLQNPEQKKTIIVSGIVDDIMIECLNYTFVGDKIKSLLNNKPKDNDFQITTFNRYIQCLTLKDLLVYSNEELYNRYIGYLNQVNLIKQKTISQVVNDFVNNELYNQRTTLIQLLLKSNEYEYQYLAYLLYDLLSSDSNGNIDTHEQTLLFDSLPWNVRKFFRDAMKQTIQYTNNLSNFDNNKIPLEQQICLMKASDNVKEKAMIKLKEVKAKSEDSGSKARQYLDGLLKIPFGIYKQEPILSVMNDMRRIFNDLMQKINVSSLQEITFPVKNNYTSLEICKYKNILREKYSNNLNENIVLKIKTILNDCSRNELINHIIAINKINKKHKIKIHKICHSGKNSNYMKDAINAYLENIKTENTNVIIELSEHFKLLKQGSDNIVNLVNNSIDLLDANFNKINNYIIDVNKILDVAVHGHDKAKRQVERIIGQWINGEKSGYCFGFEGPPGVGKTSLAKKGIAECLKNNDGISRPFSFIAIGGSSNGSTLEGHNYTYVGSTWGRIVDILMEKKCMNPIIFIDELDKVSRTEHGKEIIGILTHLIDPTQNDTFQDKYFNGVDLDLSKVLFIFSYNDVEAIDKILLDRIHRIKFEHLTLEDKLVITRMYILPEIFTKMGLEDVIHFSDEIIEYIIEEYTFEPGVRKLKEILFEIIGEINLSILKENKQYEIPINVTIDDIRNKYLKDRHEIKNKKIHKIPTIGLINGLWANSLGKGGVLPIEAKLFPSSTFLELKLTGMQGDVMKESMNVAKTLAWSLLEKEKMKELAKDFEETKLQAMHIHCPEGATPKDGPSAGTAITIVIYSLLSGKKIKNEIAITGEICLQGHVTAIGGLDLKILGGIRAGVKTFLYPKENNKDFNDFYEKYSGKEILNGIQFKEVEHINEVINLVFE